MENWRRRARSSHVYVCVNLRDSNDGACLEERRKRHGGVWFPDQSVQLIRQTGQLAKIINKNRNEAKSTVIEAFLCGRPVGHCATMMHRLINRQRLSNCMSIGGNNKIRRWRRPVSARKSISYVLIKAVTSLWRASCHVARFIRTADVIFNRHVERRLRFLFGQTCHAAINDSRI